MSGGAVQLVATGIQDAHLTGKPEVSFFRSNFKRHTHFAMSQEFQLINAPVSAGGISTVRIEKKGDLLSYVYFTARDSSVNNMVQYIDWSKVINKVELVIGGQVIDSQDVFFSNTISPTYISSSYSQKFFNNNGLTNFYPLQFFFCKDFQSVLPLIALQYHDVELRITWNPITTSNEALDSTSPYSSTVKYRDLEYRCWANFIYLDQDEREWFAKTKHDMIIWQVQTTPAQPVQTQELAFSHPVKFLAFPSSPYTRSGQTLKLQINGVDIGLDRGLPHYTTVAQYYHTQFGYDPSIFKSSSDLGLASTIAPSFQTTALVPFCLDTTKLQPTGSINFSRIDTFRLVTSPGATIYASTPTANIIPKTMTTGLSSLIYAVNYNILRVQNGMAGLLYSS